jgi:PAS domain S-box-containing protein
MMRAGGSEYVRSLWGQGSQPRLARTNHAVRTGSFAYCYLVIGLHLSTAGAGLGTWLLLTLQFLVYPHLVYWRALRSAQPNRAERDNLYLDAAFLGAWSAYLGFPTWIVFGLIGATLLNGAVNRGVIGAALSLGCSAAGAAACVAVCGLAYTPATGNLVTALAFLGVLSYTTAVGLVVHRQNARIQSARTALRRSEERYRMIAENAADLIAMVDEGGRWVYASPSYHRVLDAQLLDAGGDAFARFHPDDAELARNAVARAAESGRSREMHVRLVDREGRLRQLRMRVQAVNDPAVQSEAGGPKRVVLVSHDVTDLRESEERLLLAAHALEGMTEAIMISTADGTVLTVNGQPCLHPDHRLHPRGRPRPARDRGAHRPAAAVLLRHDLRNRAQRRLLVRHHLEQAQERLGVPRVAQRARGARPGRRGDPFRGGFHGSRRLP